MSDVITRTSTHPGTLPEPGGREQDIPETALTVLHGFSRSELQARAAEHREKFEQDCRNEGKYLPSENELDRWFSV